MNKYGCSRGAPGEGLIIDGVRIRITTYNPDRIAQQNLIGFLRHDLIPRSQIKSTKIIAIGE